MRVRIGLLLLCLQLAGLANAQSQQVQKADTVSAAVKFIRDWEKDFLDGGIVMGKDSFHIGDEAKRLLADAQYRTATYPASYNWPEALQLLQAMELKKAFWHFINLYRTDPPHKELVLQTFVKYDSLVDMEKILVNTFYTYALTDPQICSFKNGKPVIDHPDILEAKLNTTREIIAIVKYNRKESAKK